MKVSLKIIKKELSNGKTLKEIYEKSPVLQKEYSRYDSFERGYERALKKELSIPMNSDSHKTYSPPDSTSKMSFQELEYFVESPEFEKLTLNEQRKIWAQYDKQVKNTEFKQPLIYMEDNKNIIVRDIGNVEYVADFKQETLSDLFSYDDLTFPMTSDSHKTYSTPDSTSKTYSKGGFKIKDVEGIEYIKYILQELEAGESFFKIYSKQPKVMINFSKVEHFKRGFERLLLNKYPEEYQYYLNLRLGDAPKDTPWDEYDRITMIDTVHQDGLKVYQKMNDKLGVKQAPMTAIEKEQGKLMDKAYSDEVKPYHSLIKDLRFTDKLTYRQISNFMNQNHRFEIDPKTVYEVVKKIAILTMLGFA